METSSILKMIFKGNNETNFTKLGKPGFPKSNRIIGALIKASRFRSLTTRRPLDFCGASVSSEEKISVLSVCCPDSNFVLLARRLSLLHFPIRV